MWLSSSFVYGPVNKVVDGALPGGDLKSVRELLTGAARQFR